MKINGNTIKPGMVLQHNGGLWVVTKASHVKPGKGGAFFVHTTDGGATAGCVAIDDGKLVEIMRWLRPGAMIAITE